MKKNILLIATLFPLGVFASEKSTKNKLDSNATLSLNQEKKDAKNQFLKTSSSKSNQNKSQNIQNNTKKLVNKSTLIDSLVAAYRNNPEIQKALHEAMSNHEKTRQAYADFAPVMQAEAELSRNGNSVSGDQKDYEQTLNPHSTLKTKGGLNLEWNIFKGGASSAQLKKTNSLVRQSWIKLKLAEQKVLLSVARCYSDIQCQIATIKACQATVVANTKTREFAISKEKIGEGTKTEVAETEQRLAESEATLAEANAKLEQLHALFVNLTDIPVPKKLDSISSYNKLPKTLEMALSRAKEFNLNIIEASFGYEITKTDIELQGSQLAPKIDAFANVSSVENHSSGDKFVSNSGTILPEVTNKTTSRTFGLRMTIPIFEGGLIRSKVREAHEISRTAAFVAEDVKAQVFEKVKTAWAQWQKAKSSVVFHTRNVEAGKIRLEGTYQAMVAGTKVILDVLNAQYELLRAEVRLAESIRDAFYYEFEIMNYLSMLNPETLGMPIASLDPKSHFEETRVRF